MRDENHQAPVVLERYPFRDSAGFRATLTKTCMRITGSVHQETADTATSREVELVLSGPVRARH